MTACCCRLTQPETSRSRKAIGRGSESMAEACRGEAARFKVRRLFPGGTSLPIEFPHTTGLRLSTSRSSAQPGPCHSESILIARRRARCPSSAARWVRCAPEVYGPAPKRGVLHSHRHRHVRVSDSDLPRCCAHGRGCHPDIVGDAKFPCRAPYAHPHLRPALPGM